MSTEEIVANVEGGESIDQEEVTESPPPVLENPHVRHNFIRTIRSIDYRIMYEITHNVQNSNTVVYLNRFS